ncbi:MAG: hypothetical protein J6U92_04280 [Clostridia bacterium]|nr:hypothetical protein [Clostridia bacterium]
MNFDFLPNDILIQLLKNNVDKITEIRLREGFPVILSYDNDRYYLSSDLSKDKSNAVICKKEHIDYIVTKVCEYSVYAYNDKICSGFLTTCDGIRIGLAGECVFNGEDIVTIKNISSLNIRIPHEVSGCCDKFYSNLFNQNTEFLSSLIISPPFCGKTTMLKELALKLNALNQYSILIIDERGEFNKIKGENIDVVKNSNKLYAFQYALRSLSPNIVITDELITQNDWLCVKNAVNSGVKIVASVHARSLDEVCAKNEFIPNLFDRYIVLNSNAVPGVLKGIFNKEYLPL